MIKLLGLGSGFMLGMAYVFEYGMGLAPCTMCYWQRVPHGIVIALGVLAVMPFLAQSSLFIRLMLNPWHHQPSGRGRHRRLAQRG